MEKLKRVEAWLRLVRVEHALMSSAGVFAAIAIAIKAGAQIGALEFGLALLVPVLINLGAFALNDYFDVEADRANNRKERPIVSGEINPQNAGIFGWAMLFVGSLIGFLINFEAGIIALLFGSASFAYNWKLKDIAVAGNLFISMSMGISFVFGGVVAGFSVAHIPIELAVLSIGSAGAGFGREIVKSVQDAKGDKEARNSKTLPILIGKDNSLRIAAFGFALFAICVLWIVVNSQILELNILSMGILAICAFAYMTFAYFCVRARMDSQRIEQVRKLSLELLALALVAILLCAI